MQLKMSDGSMADLTTEEYAQLVALGLVAKPQTQADKLREALDAAASVPTAAWTQTYTGDGNGTMAVMPTMDEAEPEDLPAPAKMPKHATMPPIAHVTQAQQLVMDLLRHYPLGLKTSEIAEKLRWDHPKATRITTAMERGHNGTPKLVERVPGHYKYKLSEIGARSAFKVVSQPARMR